MEQVLWLAGWWIFVGFLIWAIYAFRNFLSRPRFRSDGDISTEVGYEEDPYGFPKPEDDDTAIEAASTARGDGPTPTPHQVPPSI